MRYLCQHLVTAFLSELFWPYSLCKFSLAVGLVASPTGFAYLLQAKLYGEDGTCWNFIPFKTEALVRPRLRWFTGRVGQLPVFLVMLMAACMMVPIPGTNTVPAMVVFLIGMGLSQNDGLVLCLGSLAGVGAVVLTLLIIKFGKEVIKGWLSVG